MFCDTEIAGAAGPYVVDLQSHQPYEAAALVLTLLAYPPSGAPTPALERRHEEVCAYVLRRLAEMRPGWASERQLIRPAHALRPLSKSAARKLQTELQHRLAAGRMAVPFIDHAALGAVAALPPGAQRLSLNKAADYFAGAETNTSNLKNRGFQPSRPVLHLCAALAWMRAWLGEPRPGDERSLADFLIGEMAVLRAFVTLAQDFEALLLASAKLNIRPESLVRVRWADH